MSIMGSEAEFQQDVPGTGHLAAGMTYGQLAFGAFVGLILVAWLSPMVYSTIIAPLTATAPPKITTEERERSRLERLQKMADAHDEAVRLAKERDIARKAALAEEEAKRLALNADKGPGERLASPVKPAVPDPATAAAVAKQARLQAALARARGQQAGHASETGSGEAAAATNPSTVRSGLSVKPTAADIKRELEALQVARLALALERLWSEPTGEAAKDAVTIVFRVHDWRGETRMERKFPADAPLQAVLDAVHALCPGGFTDRSLATVHPRAVLASWDAYDLSKVNTEVDVIAARAQWRDDLTEAGHSPNKAAGADSKAGGPHVLASTATEVAKASIASRGFKGRVTLVLRPTDADWVS